jgi:hypothetical protein
MSLPKNFTDARGIAAKNSNRHRCTGGNLLV